MQVTARLYFCVLCRCQVVICRTCDRGHIYCNETCSKQSRQVRQKLANCRYQNAPQGRFKHADRQRRYRRHQNIVTYQSSVTEVPDAVLPKILEQAVSTTARVRVDSVMPSGSHDTTFHCSFCGIACSDFVRSGFMRHSRDRLMTKPVRRGSRRGHFP